MVFGFVLVVAIEIFFVDVMLIAVQNIALRSGQFPVVDITVFVYLLVVLFAHMEKHHAVFVGGCGSNLLAVKVQTKFRTLQSHAVMPVNLI